MEKLALLPILADFLVYPGPASVQRFVLRAGELAHLNPPVSEQLTPFVEHVRSHSLTDLQELFTQTFDLNPVCSLEVGWHLFGEDYRRGRFLAFLRRQLRENGIRESGELPDHLTHMLPLLSRLDEGQAERLGRSYVGPAVRKMAATLEEQSSPFLPILQAVESILVSSWGPIPDVPPADIPAQAHLEVAP